MQPKVSVIIPVYNTEEYLEKCLQSVLNQDLKDVEILIIDDVSTDNSLKILEKFKIDDERIILKKFEYNQGQAKGRNWGLSQAKGDYILFVDSDDFMVPNILKTIYNKAIKEDLEILEARYFRLTEVRTTKHPQKFKLLKEVVPGDKYWKESGSISIIVWNKIYKRTFLVDNNILFKDRKFEDEDFVVRAFMNAKRVKNAELFIYNYLIRENSTMRSAITPKKVKDYVDLTQDLDRLYSLADSVEMKGGIQKLLNYNFLGATKYFENLESEEVRSDFLRFKKVYKKYRWKILNNKQTNFAIRILPFLNPFLANRLYETIKPR